MKYIDKTTKSGKVVKLKNYKKRARRNRIKRRLALFLLIFIAFAVFFTNVPFMRVKNIYCYGNSKVTSDELVSASGFCIGNNIIRVNKAKALDEIAKLPYVKTVKIRRKLPSRINIAITECDVAAYAKLGDTYIYIDEDGKVLQESDVPPETASCVLSGVNVTKHVPGQIISFKNEKQIAAYSTLVKALNKSGFNGIVTIIDLTDTQNLKFSVNNSLEVIVGTTEDLDYKIDFLAFGAYSNIGPNRTGTVDVSYGSSAVFKETY